MKKLMLLAAILILPASFASAQGLNQQDVIQLNTKQQKKEITSDFPPQTQTQECKLISVSIPASPKDKPATYHLAVKDNADGLVDAMKACNPRAEVKAFIPDSTKSAAIKVTQNTEGVAYLKVPSDRTERLILSFSTSVAEWKADRFWDSNGPIGAKTDVTLVVTAEGKQFK